MVSNCSHSRVLQGGTGGWSRKHSKSNEGVGCDSSGNALVCPMQIGMSNANTR